jgi:hypothetical protein
LCGGGGGLALPSAWQNVLLSTNKGMNVIIAFTKVSLEKVETKIIRSNKGLFLVKPKFGIQHFKSTSAGKQN